MARGRPRKVETKDALQSVMIAFWQNGFSGTSMNDLAVASGMAKPGLYAAFGDKEAIFEKALKLFLKRRCFTTLKPMAGRCSTGFRKPGNISSKISETFSVQSPI